MTTGNSPQVAAVTGANRGLGLAAACGLAARGFVVVAVCRGEDKAQKAAAEIGGGAVGFSADVASPADVAALAKFIGGEFGRLDVLINNAGIIAEGDLSNWGGVATCDADKVAETLNINAIGAYRTTAALLPLLKKSPAGRIVNVSSELGSLAGMGAGLPGYRMSKAAMNALTRTLAAELGEGSPLKVNAVSPGWVRTDMGGAGAARSIDEGAASILWAALLPADGASGGFFRDGAAVDW